MAQQATVTTTARRTSTTTTTTKPQFKLAAPFFRPVKSNKPKQPYDDLLMGEPGPDEDQHANRVEVVDYMLCLAAESRQYKFAINWKNQPVFDDDDEKVQTPVKRTDSGAGATEGVEVGAARKMEIDEDYDVSEDEEVVKTEPAKKKQKSIWDDPSSIVWDGVVKEEKSKFGDGEDGWKLW